MVPCVCAPASATHLGRERGEEDRRGFAPVTVTCAWTRYSVPWWLTCPSRRADSGTATYSFMCVYDFAQESPSIGLDHDLVGQADAQGEAQPPQAALVESACCAIADGMARSRSARPRSRARSAVDARPASAHAVIASMPKMFANHADAKPSRSADFTCSIRSSTVAGCRRSLRCRFRFA